MTLKEKIAFNIASGKIRKQLLVVDLPLLEKLKDLINKEIERKKKLKNVRNKNKL